MSEDRCQVANLDGTEECAGEPHWIVTWPVGVVRDMRSATLCQRCGLNWIERFTAEGKVVTVRPALRRMLRV